MYKFDVNIDSQNANIVKKCFIDAMLEQGIITEETYAEMEEFAVICVEPKVLGSHIDSLHESKAPQFFVVKVVDIPKPSEIENADFLATQEELHAKIKGQEEEILRLKGEIIRLSHLPETEPLSRYVNTCEEKGVLTYTTNSFEETEGLK